MKEFIENHPIFCYMICATIVIAIIFAWFFFYIDDEAMIIFAALLVSLLIGTIVFSVGLGMTIFLTRKKGEQR